MQHIVNGSMTWGDFGGIKISVYIIQLGWKICLKMTQ